MLRVISTVDFCAKEADFVEGGGKQSAFVSQVPF